MTKKKNETIRIRQWVFWPPFLVLVLVLGFVSQNTFLNMVNNVKAWIWGNFRWMFSGYGMVTVLVCCYGSIYRCWRGQDSGKHWRLPLHVPADSRLCSAD